MSSEQDEGRGNRGSIFDRLVQDERIRQDQRWDTSQDLDIRAWVSILARNAGRVIDAMCGVDEGAFGNPLDEAQEELVHLAAIVRCIYETDVLVRRPANRENLAIRCTKLEAVAASARKLFALAASDAPLDADVAVKLGRALDACDGTAIMGEFAAKEESR